MVVILAILLGMGTPTFLGVRARFQNRAAQTDLRNTLLAARILYTDTASFPTSGIETTGLVQIVPNMCYVSGATASTATQFSAARDVQLDFVLRDPGYRDGDEVWKDGRSQLQRHVGGHGWQRHGGHPCGRRLVGQLPILR